MTHLLEVLDLITEFDTEGGIVHAVNGISYSLNAGESLAIVGESGSGKTVGVLSIMGLIPKPPGRVKSGEAVFAGQDLLQISEEELRQIRGNEMSMVFQDPMTSLNPVLTVGLQLTEGLEEHQGMSRKEAQKKAVEMLSLVGIPDAEDRLKDYPHQFSGGQRQRIGIAMGLSSNPALLIADEPTTALDVTIQAQIIELVAGLQKQLGMAIIWITHDLGVVASLVEKVAVMYAGHIVEMAPTRDLYKKTAHPYTLGLLESIPSIEAKEERLIPIKGSPPDLHQEMTFCPFAPRCRYVVDKCLEENPPLISVDTNHLSACWRAEEVFNGLVIADNEEEISTEIQEGDGKEPKVQDEILIEVRNLEKHFPIKRGIIKRTVGAVRAVDGVSFEIRRGETLGLVGESGCGKSTTGLAILRLHEATNGEVIFEGQNLIELDKNELREARRHMQMIFQDPYASLNPRQTVGRIVSEGLRTHGIGDAKSRDQRVGDLLKLVGLNPYFVNRFPHEFSGGQRQRIGIARALATEPSFIVADEPIAALDVSIQAQVVNLLDDLKRDLGLTYLFIAHDLSMVRYISDRVAVMYLGRIVELTDRDELFEKPVHPYTQALLSAIPVPDPDIEENRERIVLEGDVPNPADPPPACTFHTRCVYATDICRTEQPEFRDINSGDDPHFVACHHAEQFI